MANTTTVIRITHPEGVADLKIPARPASEGKQAIQDLINYLQQLASGTRRGTVEVQRGCLAAVRASQTLTLSSASGTVGGTIGGTAVTVTYATSDANTAGLIATAINANTTVNKKVYATAAGAVVTIRAVSPGVNGNAVTTVASGTGVTAGGATLTGGAGDNVAPTTYTGNI